MPEVMTTEQLKEYVQNMPDDEIVSVTIVFDKDGERDDRKEQA